MSIATEKVGARIYITGNSFAVKDRLKAEGAHWDNDRKQWWIGAQKASAIDHIINATPAPAQQNSTATATDDRSMGTVPGALKVLAKAKYKGKLYYVLWMGRVKATGVYKCRLTVLDGSIDFWVKCAEYHETQIDGNGDVAKIIKTYQVREYRGREEYTTLNSLRQFIESQKQAEVRGDDACAACGKRSSNLHHDLEDGMLKCYNCCDIPR